LNSRAVLYNKVGNDESYTPDYAVKPILKYIPDEAVVWCPFDTHESEFVRMIGWRNTVHYSHIDRGEDFFEYEPPYWDVMVSNPPFKNKRKFFERALSFGKPFALLMTLTWLNDSAPKVIFREAGRNLQLLMFDNRIKFITGRPNNKITFSSAYYCCDMLPRDIILYGKV